MFRILDWFIAVLPHTEVLNDYEAMHLLYQWTWSHRSLLCRNSVLGNKHQARDQIFLNWHIFNWNICERIWYFNYYFFWFSKDMRNYVAEYVLKSEFLHIASHQAAKSLELYVVPQQIDYSRLCVCVCGGGGGRLYVNLKTITDWLLGFSVSLDI